MSDKALPSPHVHVPFDKAYDYIHFIKEHRLNLEIYFDANTLDSILPNDVERFMKSLDYIPSISVHAPFMDLCPGAVDPKIRAVTIERFVKTIDTASLMNPKTIVFHSGYEKWKYGLKPDVWLKQSIMTWEHILNMSEKTGVRIAVENIFEDEPSNLIQLMKNIGSERFGICFDTGHFNLFSKSPLAEWLTPLLPYIIEFHLHDNDKSFDSHLPIGDGTFKWDEFFANIKESRTVFTIEAHNPERVLKSIERFGELYQRYLA